MALGAFGAETLLGIILGAGGFHYLLRYVKAPARVLRFTRRRFLALAVSCLAALAGLLLRAFLPAPLGPALAWWFFPLAIVAFVVAVRFGKRAQALHEPEGAAAMGGAPALVAIATNLLVVVGFAGLVLIALIQLVQHFL